MDRDMVNCLHYLYQWGELTRDRAAAPLFWCVTDTFNPLEGRRIVAGDVHGNGLRLQSGVYDLIDMIEGQLRTLPTPNYTFGYPISAPIRPPGGQRPAFLAISYAPAFDAVKNAVVTAAMDANFRCEITGDLGNPGNIMDQVWQGIRGADVVVADITGSNPNVFYEIGLAHALGKEVILISQDADAPFDVRASRRVHYDAADLDGLRTQLGAAFASVSARYPHEGPEPRF